MDLTEQQAITGTVTIWLKDTSGTLLEQRQVKNVITNAGKNLMAKYFTGELQATANLTIAVGRDATAASPSDEALGDFIEEAAANTVVENSRATVTATLPATGSGETQDLREAGIVIKVPGDVPPVLYNRVTFDVVNKSPNMEITLTWEVVF